jgi:hypothetical protein
METELQDIGRVIQGVTFKVQQSSSVAFYGTKMKPDVIPPPVGKTLPSSPLALELESPRLLGRYSRQLIRNCTGAKMVYSRAEIVFIIERYFASKLFAAVYEAFTYSYSDNEILNTTIYRMATAFWVTGSVCG